MPRVRTPKSTQKTNYDKFISGADKTEELDPKAKRDFKAINITLNEYEYDLITKELILSMKSNCDSGCF